MFGFSLQARIVAVLAAIAIIAGGLWKLRHDAYHAGAESVRKEYAAAATQAALAAIKTQERLQEAVQRVGERNEQAKRQNAAAAAGAEHELGSLREQLAARDRADAAATGAACGAHAAGAERELLGHCASALVGLAKEADRVEAKLIGLQDYVRSVIQGERPKPLAD